MKKFVRIAGLILLILIALSCGYYAGRNSTIKPVDQETFYATIEEIRETDIMVQGLEINDINQRCKFQLNIDEDTKLVWRGVPISIGNLKVGDIISITYTGLISETSPAHIKEVVRIQALGDELGERERL